MKIGFLGVLTILFIALKLCGVIAWSWWLVLLPMYFIVALVLGLLVVGVVGIFGAAGIASAVEKFKKKK